MRSLHEALKRMFSGSWPSGLQRRPWEPVDLRPDVVDLSRKHRITEMCEAGFRDAGGDEVAFLMESLNANLGSPYGPF